MSRRVWPGATTSAEEPSNQATPAGGPSLAYERLSDPILVKRAKDGDRQALEALCARHQPAVEKLARRILRDPEDARDATQESLAKVCTRIRQFRGESQFATWLHRLVGEHVPRRARAAPLVGGAARRPDAPPPTGDVGDRGELRACLLELPPAQARVVVLKDALGYSFEEISAASGMPVGTAKCYAHRARNTLRERLEERVA